MQQTQNYRLNKPETSDPFSPEPLSRNMDTVDAALADVSQRVIKLEGCRIIVGVYQRYVTNGGQIIDLGGRPAAVLVSTHSMGHPMAGVVGNEKVNGDGGMNLRIVDNGFEVRDLLTNGQATYSFIAFMGDWEPVYIPKYVP